MSKENQWQVIGLSESLPADKPVGVHCDGVEYVLFRDAHGVPRALEDACAHRRAPLSLGCITNTGLIECPYHGWRYDGSGACKVIPNLSADEKVPRSYRVTGYAVHEQDGFLQLWTGGLEPTAPPLSLAMSPMAAEWFGERLIAYPFREFIDLLLDAPGAILDINGLASRDDHRFGDPILDAKSICVEYGVASRATARSGRVISDFPYSLVLNVRRDGRQSKLQLLDNSRKLLSETMLIARPVERALTAVKWRGTGTATQRGLLRITARDRIDPHAVMKAKDYCSRLCSASFAPTGEGEFA
ncbi:Rieske (2Fe-2S) protein [Sphingobium baderi]|nr:Rieske (2Fe-2S) protein [Sphingobium baderi]